MCVRVTNHSLNKSNHLKLLNLCLCHRSAICRLPLSITNAANGFIFR